MECRLEGLKISGKIGDVPVTESFWKLLGNLPIYQKLSGNLPAPKTLRGFTNATNRQQVNAFQHHTIKCGYCKP